MTDIASSNISPAKHVIIVGGGFAGLNCAMKLAHDARLRITLIDRNNYQQFQPLLYQVATGILSAENAAFNLRDLFSRHSNVEVKMSEVVSIDLHTKTVHGRNGDQYQGDTLVLAAGAQANFFSIPGADQHSFPMYTLQDAERLRSKLLNCLEDGQLKTDSVEANSTVLVVGAGATGVETAGAIADMLRRYPKHLVTSNNAPDTKVMLIDMASTVLAQFSRQSQTYAARILRERNVELKLCVSVKEVTSTEVLLSDGSRVPSRLVIWAGGLKASNLSENIGINIGRSGRLDVQANLSLFGHPDVYALGDFANVLAPDGKPLPQLASVAQQAGRHCAGNIMAALDGYEPTAFSYFDKGIMAMVGREAAIAEIGPFRFPICGPSAFAAWLAVHAALLTTARAEMDTLIEWAWDYFGKTHVGAILDRPNVVKHSVIS